MSQRAVALMILAVTLAGTSACARHTEPPDPTLRAVDQGQIAGLVQDNGSYAWTKIPHAQPPIGNLRWKAPRPATPWDGVYQATETIQPCLQFASGLTAGIEDPDGDGVVGSEDCLYLSVYAPGGPSSDRRLPVMYWIFGGGNNSGYAGDYDAGTLAQSENVVVVTVNYRLGALGWFLHPAILDEDVRGADASGNWATLDTLRGLEWVRDNIAAFGGDPGNVTIFGESAGGSNVLTLVTSPMATGLFHRAVVESGGLGTASMAEAMNYADETERGSAFSSREIVNKILVAEGKAPNRDAAKALQQSMSDAEIRTLLYAQEPAGFLRLYNPEGARNYPSPKKYRDGTVIVEQPPLDQLGSGEYNKVPIVLGTNRDERRIYMYREWADVIRKDPDEYVRASKYPSDMRKVQGVDALARVLAGAQGEGVFAYRFDWDEQGTTADGLDLSLGIGAAHSTEMAFVFGNWEVGFVRNPALYPPASMAGRDQLSRAMMSYWANFAYTGTPGRGRQGDLPEWQPWQNGDGQPKMIVLDAEDDGGIRMSSEEMTLQSLKAEFMRERFSSQRNLCATYEETFGETTAFDPKEYARLGDGGCDSN